jgi:HK97 gp10 family phage protein
MIEETTLVGAEELQKILLEMPRELTAKALREGAKAGAEVILEAARAKAPVYNGPPRPDVQPGLLRDSLKVTVRAKEEEVTATVSTSEGDYKGDDFYASFIEFGHKVGKRPGKARGVKVEDGRPTVAPRPFLRPAFDNNKDRAVEAFRAAVTAAIDRIWGR